MFQLSSCAFVLNSFCSISANVTGKEFSNGYMTPKINPLIWFLFYYSSLSSSSVPCVPSGVQASLLCSSNSAAVSWLSSSGALRYQANAVNINGSQTVSCNSSLPSCTVGPLLCGTSYNVNVVALDDVCTSGSSVAMQVRSGEGTDLIVTHIYVQ